MSRLRANQITNENANGAPNFPHGLTVTGIVTATTSAQTMSQIVVGSAVTANSQGIDVTGIVTATSFSGSGANLTSLPAANLTGTLPAISGASLTNIPVSTGGIVQVKNTTLTSAYSDNTNSGAIWSFNNDLLRVTITASSASNFFLITGQVVIGSNGLAVSSMLYDNNSPVTTSGSRGDAASNRRQSLSGDDSGNTEGVFTIPIHAYISCADTNEHKFHYAFWHNSGGQSYIHLNRSNTDTDTNKRGRYISNITVMEIKG